MATLGLRDLFIAPITIVDGKETYGTPRRLAKAISADVSIAVAENVLYADDGVDEIVGEFTKGALKLKTNDLIPSDSAELLGQKTDEDGVVFAGESDDPPYFGVAFRAKKTGGLYRYIWFYKVKFKIPNEKFETKGSGINMSTPEIEGEIIKRDSDDNWKADYTGLPTSEAAVTWFESVREPKGEIA